MPKLFDKAARFTLSTEPQQIPGTVMKASATALLDTLGIAIGAASLEAGVIARDTACALYSTNDSNLSARMLFDGRRVSLAGAAYSAATQTDNLDGHDGYNPSKGHIGVAVVPALAAIAETVDDISGQEALATLVIGYEIAGRAGIALHNTVSDYHTSGAWNALGVVAMAARLRQHSDAQLRHAFGIAEYHGPRSQMMREIANPTMLHDGSGWGAMVGLSAAVLAEKGFTGAPAITIEEQSVATYWEDLGKFWQTEHQYVKPYPVCRWAHAAIDAVRQLCETHSADADNIEKIQINTFTEAACLYDGMPNTTSEAQYSLHFAVAIMLIHKHIGVEHITGEGLKDHRVESVISRIHVTATDQYSDQFPAHRRADVQITLSDGKLLDSGTVDASGGHESPLSEDAIEEKFMSYAAPVLGDARARAIAQQVQHLTERDSRFSDLSSLLYDQPEYPGK